MSSPRIQYGDFAARGLTLPSLSLSAVKFRVKLEPLGMWRPGYRRRGESLGRQTRNFVRHICFQGEITILMQVITKQGETTAIRGLAELQSASGTRSPFWTA